MKRNIFLFVLFCWCFFSTQLLVAQNSAVIKIDIDRKIGEIDRNIYGVFIEPIGDVVYGRLYDPASPLANTDGFRTDLITFCKELHIPVVRWPGGNYSSGYNWEDGIGPRQDRPVRKELAWHAVDHNQMGTDEYAKFCKLINAESLVCINGGTGTLEQARHWVEYCNVDKATYYSDLRRKNGTEAPEKIKYWALGNEIDGNWQIGYKSKEDYCKFAKEAAKVMKLTDSNIKLIASGASNYWTPNDKGVKDWPVSDKWIEWNRYVINDLVDQIDYISIHRYISDINKTDKENNFPGFMATNLDIEQKIEIVKAQIKEALIRTDKKKNVYISFDEYSASGEDLASMLALALQLNTFIRNADIIKMANFTMLTNLMGYSPKGLYKNALFDAFSLFSNNCSGVSLNALTLCKTYDNGDFKKVPYLDVSVAYKDAEGELVINVVNRSETEDISTSIFAQTKNFDNDASVFVVNGKSIKSANTHDEQSVTVNKSTIKPKGNEIEYKFLAHSYTMIKVKLK